MARRGRKHQMNAKRRATTAEGRSADLAPTPELIGHRLREHGLEHVGTEHPLDALAAKGLLAERLPDEERGDWLGRNLAMRDTGARFYALHRAVFGSADPQALDLARPIGDGGTIQSATSETEGEIGRAARYRTISAALRAAGTRVHHVTMNVVVYRRKLPDPVDRPASFHHTLEALRKGLAVIAPGRRSPVRAMPARAAE